MEMKLKKSAVVATRFILLIAFIVLFPLIFLLVSASMDDDPNDKRGFWQIVFDIYYGLLTGKGFDDEEIC